MIKVLFGQYRFKNSFIHKLDPRIKLLYVIALSILVFAINNFSKILIFSIFIAVIILLSKIRVRALIKGLSPFYFIFIFIFLMYLIFSRNKIEQGLITIWRFLMLIVISFVLTYATTIPNLITALEKLLKPLKIINVKPRNVATMISITVRFVPVMFINLERLKEAMLARLANFRKLKHANSLMIALLERMFKSASNLTDAMQSRLYNENVESHKILELKEYDYVSIILVSMFIALIIY